ncbi:MAG: aminoacyl-tRNA hydrolase [Deltaproteobacteria bacterium]|nr:MAG: aminoacyl-tRNA hydrolase [Deltaproteobacteria bacterium]
MSDRPFKQVLLYRRDLKMRKGKIAAQCAHASLAVFLSRQVRAVAVPVADDGTVGGEPLDPGRTMVLELDEAMAAWVRHGSAKIVLSVDDEAALLRAHQLAVDAGLPTALIRDAGHTEFGGVPTLTACAIGPARVEDIDPITGPEGAVATKLA